MTTDFAELLSFSEVGRLLPSKPGPATLWRWHTVGVYGIRLQTVLIGGRRFCSRQSLEDFIQATTAARERAVPDASTERSPETEAALRESGLLERRRPGRPRNQPAAAR